MKQLVFVIVVMFYSLGLSQVVDGIITDPLTGKGIPNLTVALGDCTTTTDSNGYYKIVLGVTNVENNSEHLPKEFRLAQNFPNPFNPTTTIKFDVPREEIVTLRIYALTGQLVRTLVEGKIQSGTHSVYWDGTNHSGKILTSGLYIYNFRSSTFVESKKMIFLK